VQFVRVPAQFTVDAVTMQFVRVPAQFTVDAVTMYSQHYVTYTYQHPNKLGYTGNCVLENQPFLKNLSFVTSFLLFCYKFSTITDHTFSVF
jgi:hypothetical protein